MENLKAIPVLIDIQWGQARALPSTFPGAYHRDPGVSILTEGLEKGFPLASKRRIALSNPSVFVHALPLGAYPVTLKKNIPHLSLKHKIYLSLTLYIFSIVVLGCLSFYDLVRIGGRVNLLADFDQLTNMILEVRRFEKNYLLYLNDGDLAEARKYITNARVSIDNLMESGERNNALLSRLQVTLEEYCMVLDTVASTISNSRIHSTKNVEALRNAGKRMVDLAETMGKQEKRAIRNRLHMLKMQLTASVVCALLLGFIGTYVLFGKMFRAMDVIVDATRKIGRGQFDPLPEMGAQQETQRIINAFNQMTRELELRQEQLVQARKLSSLGTLTAGIAHQLNNPLNNISTSSQLALEELEDNDIAFTRKMLANIEQESARAKEIVQGLLEFARERSFSPTRVNLAGLVKKTLRLVSSQVPPGIDIMTDIPEDLELTLDKQRMQEALLNLIINATQAMPLERGSRGRISIIARPPKEKGFGYASITISDTGVGISKENLKHVFDPFFTTKEERVGTGLGLSIVYGIVEKHGGSISMDSEEGQGTDITIRLPVDA
jgi:two-component system, NtrC family, sensor kinase